MPRGGNILRRMCFVLATFGSLGKIMIISDKWF